MNKRTKIYITVMIGISIFITTFGIFQYLWGKSHLYRNDQMIDQMELVEGRASEDGKEYWIDDSADGVVHFLHGPNIALHKGVYELKITYQATESSSFVFAYAEGSDSDTLYSEMIYYEKNKTTQEMTIYVKKDVSNIEFRTIFLDEGSLKITSMELVETMYPYQSVLFVCILVSCLLIFLCYIYSKHMNQKTKRKSQPEIVIGLGLIIFIASIPLLSNYIFAGYDLNFQLVRIEGVKEGLLTGQFPVRVQPLWMNGSGYGVSMGYGDIFLYIPAILRMIGISVQACYQILLFLCNVATCYVAYWSFKKISGNQYAAMIGSMLYTLAPYRLTNVYIRASVGEHMAMIFLPLVVAGMWMILTAQKEDKKLAGLRWLPLALGMTGILQTHTLTLEMVTGILIITCIVFCKRLFTEGRILILIEAAIATILLNLWFILPLLDFMLGESVVLSGISTLDLQKQGAFLSQLFTLMPTFDGSGYSNYASEGVSGEMPINIGMPIILANLPIIYAIFTKKERDGKLVKASLFLLGLGIIMVVFSLHIFPWNKIEMLHPAINHLISPLEYIVRFLSPATILLTASGMLGIVYCYKHFDKIIVQIWMTVIAITVLVCAMSCIDSLISLNQSYRIYSNDSLNMQVDGVIDHFLPANMDLEYINEINFPEADEGIDLDKYVTRGMNAYMEVENNGKEGIITVPFVYYKGYRAVIEGTGEKLAVHKSEKGTLDIIIPEKCKGTLKVSYVGTWYWNAALIVSFITIIVILTLLVKKRSKQLKGLNKSLV